VGNLSFSTACAVQFDAGGEKALSSRGRRGPVIRCSGPYVVVLWTMNANWDWIFWAMRLAADSSGGHRARRRDGGHFVLRAAMPDVLAPGWARTSAPLPLFAFPGGSISLTRSCGPFRAHGAWTAGGMLVHGDFLKLAKAAGRKGRRSKSAEGMGKRLKDWEDLRRVSKLCQTGGFNVVDSSFARFGCRRFLFFSLYGDWGGRSDPRPVRHFGLDEV